MTEDQSNGMTRDEGIRTVNDGPSHVVILGAGASIAAAAHNPEPSEKKLPSMEDLIKVVGLEDIIESGGFGGKSSNFEEVYSRMHSRNPDSPAVAEIESRVANYFRSLTLPPTPTIYDYIIMALRPKDLVATFNWDPFLYQAFSRNRNVAQPPRLSFLHGNVSIGYSKEDEKAGPADWTSKATGHEYVQTQLLYPVTQKNYNADEFIAREWERLERELMRASRVTIFGYSAPETDVEAMELMSSAWGNPGQRNMEQIEFIDILPEDELIQRWNGLIFVGHYECFASYFQSSMAWFPRRTGESFMHQFLPETEDQAMQKPNPIPDRFETLEAMWEWHRPLIEAENEHNPIRSK